MAAARRLPRGRCRAAGGRLVGGHRSRRRARARDIAGVRTFVPGDRLRRVNGRVTSRHRRAARDRDVLRPRDRGAALLDSRDDLGRPPDSCLDAGVRAAAAVAEHYLLAGDRVALVDLGQRYRRCPPSQRRTQLVPDPGRAARRRRRPRTASGPDAPRGRADRPGRRARPGGAAEPADHGRLAAGGGGDVARRPVGGGGEHAAGRLRPRPPRRLHGAGLPAVAAAPGRRPAPARRGRRAGGALRGYGRSMRPTRRSRRHGSPWGRYRSRPRGRRPRAGAPVSARPGAAGALLAAAPPSCSHGRRPSGLLGLLVVRLLGWWRLTVPDRAGRLSCSGVRSAWRPIREAPRR